MLFSVKVIEVAPPEMSVLDDMDSPDASVPVSDQPAPLVFALSTVSSKVTTIVPSAVAVTVEIVGAVVVTVKVSFAPVGCTPSMVFPEASARSFPPLISSSNVPSVVTLIVTSIVTPLAPLTESIVAAPPPVDSTVNV